MTRGINPLQWIGGILSLAVALYAFQLLIGDTAAKVAHMAFHLENQPWALYAHIGCSALALAAMPMQFLPKFRARYLRLHRWAGRIYGVAILIGGLAGLILATRTDASLFTAWGFGLLAVVWIGITARAILLAMQRRIAEHSRWMICSAALTFAAVTLRLWLPLMLVSGLPFETAYALVAWLCWVPNLAVAWWLTTDFRNRAKPSVSFG